MFKTSSSDVLIKMWQVIKVLGPLYAIFFGLEGVRYLIDITGSALKKKYGKHSPRKAPRKKTSPRPKRNSVFVATGKNPRVRRTKSGVYIHFD